MRTVLVSLVSVLLICSLFVTMKIVRSQMINGMAMNPTELVVPINLTEMSFLYEINISTTYDVECWEAHIYWNHATARCSGVVWGSFMTGAPTGGYVAWFEGSMLLGQHFAAPHTVTGNGTLAYLNLTFLFPGYTTVRFLKAIVDENVGGNLIERNLLANSKDGYLKTSRPRPEFTWKTDDGRNPLPNHTIYDGGDALQHYDVVHFNASRSYDVSNLMWNGSAWVPSLGYPDIVTYRWEFGDGTFVQGPADPYNSTDHIYQNYNKNGWLVNLTVWDSEDECWSTTWHYGDQGSSDIVPMWRDLAINSIWPCLPPYENWDEYGDQWWPSRWFDTYDTWLPYTWDQYWNYTLPPSYCADFGLPSDTTVKDAWLNHNKSAGLSVLVSADNYGTVTEKVQIDLYAVGVKLKATKPPGKGYEAVFDESVELIGTWTETISAWEKTGYKCWAFWIPPMNGTYVLFATIRAAYDAVAEDQDLSNNLFVLSDAICNVCIWNTTSLTMIKDLALGKFLCDINGDGAVGSADLATLLAFFGAKPAGWPKVGTVPIVPK